jgi:O-antigen/teichoic acid export membrane protein
MNPADPVSPAESITEQAQQFRSQVGHISRQSGIFFGGTLFTAAAGYVFKIYLARTLGAEALGWYALGITLIGFFGIFNTLGLAQSAVRYVAAYVAAKTFAPLHALLWRGTAILVLANIFLAAILLTLGRGIAVRFYHLPQLVEYLPWFAMIMLFGVLNGFYGKVLSGYRDLGRRTLIINFVGSPLNMLLAVVLLGRGLGLRGYLLAQIVSAAIVCALLLAAVRELTPPEARFATGKGAALPRDVWSFSAAMLGIGLLEFLMVQVDRVALGHYLSARDVGIYSIAAAMVAYVPLVLQSINQIFSPTIADLHTRGEHALLSRLFQSLTKWVIGLTIPLAAVVIVFARPLMRIFGPDFADGWPILIIGTVGQLVNCGVGSVGYLLLMSGNQKRLIKVQSAMAAGMIGLNVLLVPVWGVVGAAVAAAVTNVGMNLLNLQQVRTALQLSPYNRSYIHLLAPSVAVVAVTMLARKMTTNVGPNWLVVGATGILAYLVFAGIVFAFGLDDDDRLIANAIWTKVRGAFDRGPSRMEL